MPRIVRALSFAGLAGLARIAGAERVSTLQEEINRQIDASATIGFATIPQSVVSAQRNCTISLEEGESCPLSEMPEDLSTVVFPGGDTGCIFGSLSTKYAFQVIPGSSDELLVHFQGGGACFNGASTLPAPQCTVNADPYLQVGVLDRDNVRNPFREFTAIVVLYCTGDFHGGNVTDVFSYVDAGGASQVGVRQANGLANTQAVLDYIVELQATHEMNPLLQEFVISGDSAGAAGAAIWARKFFEAVPAQRGFVISDSFAGVFPRDTLPELIRDYGICGFFDDFLLNLKCDAGYLTLQDIVEERLVDDGYTFIFVDSKLDPVQISSYNLVAALTATADTKVIGEAEFYFRQTRAYQSLTRGNSVFYLVNGNAQHTFLVKEYFTLASLTGPFDFRSPDRLHQVLGAARANEATLCSKCDGDPSWPVVARGTDIATTFCSRRLLRSCATIGPFDRSDDDC